MEEIMKEVKTDVKEFSSMVLKINTMNITMEKILDEQSKNAERKDTNVDNLYQMKIDKIFKASTLRITDYKETNVIRKEGYKWYLVTEWAEFGNLREFYTNYENRFNNKLKLRISLDIVRGLNFLRSVEVNIKFLFNCFI